MLFISTLAILEAIAVLTIYKQSDIISPLGHILQSVSLNSFTNTIFVNQTEAELKKDTIPFTAVTITSDGTIHVQLQENREALLSSSKDIHIQIASLQLTMNDLTIEGKAFKKLDFRFDKPIVVF